MARKAKQSGIIVCKTRTGVSPVSAYDAEQLDMMMDGVEFDLVPRSKRSLKQERVYWKALTDAVEATGKWPTKDHLHEWLRGALGFVELRFARDGTPYVVVNSTVDMEPSEYQRYFDAAMEKLADEIGYDPIGFLEEAA
jgi:hypothetical protein